jgi:hypothetical protein
MAFEVSDIITTSFPSKFQNGFDCNSSVALRIADCQRFASVRVEFSSVLIASAAMVSSNSVLIVVTFNVIVLLILFYCLLQE